MNYDKKATLLATEKISDNIGGWLDAGTTELTDIDVIHAPVTADYALREYGIVSTKSLKLYTESKLPNLEYIVLFESNKYRVLQISDFGKEKILLLELM